MHENAFQLWVGRQPRQAVVMYVPSADRGTADDVLRLLDEAALVTLVAVDGDEPVVVPTPFSLQRTADGGTWPVIEVHLHRNNPFWSAVADGGPVTVSVLGPYAFIPHDWNPRSGAPPEDGVPTSWYAAASLRCRAELVEEPGELAGLVGRLVERVEPAGLDHSIDPAARPYGPLLGAIRGVRLHVEDVVAKSKFGGTRAPEQRRDVIGRLVARARPGDAAVVDWARRALDRDTSAS